MLLKIYLIFLVAVSVVSVFVFMWDKHLSKKDDGRRIPEIVLLSFFAAGGSIGGLFGMYALRHKTDFSTKFHFGISVWLCLVLQAATAVFIVLIENEVISL